MTRISIDHGRLEIRAEGHAGYAERGADIVCAGLTALLMTFPLALEGRGIEYELEVEEAAGRYRCRAKPRADQRYPCLVAAETIMEGLRALERDYREYILIEEVS